jgi:hypothetical protein
LFEQQSQRPQSRRIYPAHVAQVGAELTGLSAFEPGLKQQNLDIEKSRLETGVTNSSDAEGIPENSTAETSQRPANLRQCGGDFRMPDMPQRDETGSLGCLDSKLEMLFCKMPFELSGGFS